MYPYIVFHYFWTKDWSFIHTANLCFLLGRHSEKTLGSIISNPIGVKLDTMSGSNISRRLTNPISIPVAVNLYS